MHGSILHSFPFLVYSTGRSGSECICSWLQVSRTFNRNLKDLYHYWMNHTLPKWLVICELTTKENMFSGRLLTIKSNCRLSFIMYFSIFHIFFLNIKNSYSLQFPSKIFPFLKKYFEFSSLQVGNCCLWKRSRFDPTIKLK